MKGVILAGGLGSRLYPLTKITNKHLLPVYDRPMIYYPLQRLVEAGIDDVLIVTGPQHVGEFIRLLEDGEEFGLKDLHFKIQKKEGGIAQALGLAEKFADGDSIAVILGDNIFQNNLTVYITKYMQINKGAQIHLKKVEDPGRFGVVEFDNELPIIKNIEEKPKQPKSDLAVTGFYIYDSKVFDIIRNLKPSSRGELEITDVNNHYLKNSLLSYEILNGYWTDAGTFESLLKANELAGGIDVLENC